MINEDATLTQVGSVIQNQYYNVCYKGNEQASTTSCTSMQKLSFMHRKLDRKSPEAHRKNCITCVQNFSN